MLRPSPALSWGIWACAGAVGVPMVPVCSTSVSPLATRGARLGQKERGFSVGERTYGLPVGARRDNPHGQEGPASTRTDTRWRWSPGKPRSSCASSRSTPTGSSTSRSCTEPALSWPAIWRGRQSVPGRRGLGLAGPRHPPSGSPPVGQRPARRIFRQRGVVGADSLMRWRTMRRSRQCSSAFKRAFGNEFRENGARGWSRGVSRGDFGWGGRCAEGGNIMAVPGTTRTRRP